MVARVLALLATIFGSSLLITTIYALGSGCNPGTFVNNAILGCQTCPNGTFSDKVNATKCSMCDECIGRHNTIARVCTLTSNTRCQCQDGYYFNDFLYCLRCTSCKRGQGVSQNCSATSNTVCELCEKGKTFSREKSMDRCKPCTTCPKGHIVRSNCTRRTDTICVPETDMNDSKNPRWEPRAVTTATATAATTTTTATNSTARKKERWKTSPKHPSTVSTHLLTITSKPVKMEINTEADTALQVVLYSLVALLVILIIALGLVCFYKKKKRPRKAVRKPGNGAEEPSTRSNSTEIIEAVENPYSSLPFISGQQGSEKMLRDVPYTLINDLAQDLNPHNRWKQLGGYLNFDTTQIGNFAIDGQNATQTMLHEWGQKDGATVVALQRTFGSMKWRREERMVGAYV